MPLSLFQLSGIIAATYGVVIFSILVQALTIGPLVKAWCAKRQPAA